MRPTAGVDFVLQCKFTGLPIPETEVAFAEGRRWRFDYAWKLPTGRRIALEREGVVYPKKGSGDYRLGGRHTSAKGFRDDVEKYLAAAELGWVVIRCLPEHIDNGRALNVVERWLK